MPLALTSGVTSTLMITKGDTDDILTTIKIQKKFSVDQVEIPSVNKDTVALYVILKGSVGVK